MRLTRAWLALAVLCSVPAVAGITRDAPSAVRASAPERELAWVRSNLFPVKLGTEPVSAREAQAILRAVGHARVIGLGEFVHGAHQPLAVRNRWVRYLVEHAGLTAVALESGLAQSRRVNDYVLGGPGDAATIVRQGLTWTFHEYPANVALVEWLREWNLTHPGRKVRFYGADVSGGDEKDELGRAALVIDEVRSYLQRTIPKESADVRHRLAPFVGRFDEHAWHAYSPAQQAALVAAIRDARSLFVRYRSHMTRRSSSSAFAWGSLMAGDMERLLAIFREWPVRDPQDMAATARVVKLRDKAMADYVLWALKQEGPRGRILSFSSNGHATKVGYDYPPISGQSVSMGPNMGEHLAHALGPAYRVVLTAPYPTKREVAGELDELLAAAYRHPFLLDLAHAGRWWQVPQRFTHANQLTIRMVPARAANALLFVGPITDEPTTNRSLRPQTAETERSS